MIGEISIGGVFVPTLLVLGIVALILTGLLIRIATASGFYRFVAYRALVDLSLFIIVFGLLAFLSPLLGFHP